MAITVEIIYTEETEPGYFPTRHVSFEAYDESEATARALRFIKNCDRERKYIGRFKRLPSTPTAKEREALTRYLSGQEDFIEEEIA